VRCILLFSLAVLLCGTLRAQPSSESFEKWAAGRAIPLRTIEADGDKKDLLPLKSLVGSAHVVAIGEPNHGTHEPLALRNRLVRFLVEEMGFTGVALETSFTESHTLARFVAGGPGDLHITVSNAMSWGFGNFPENEELIQWIREYNSNTNHHRKVRIYGIDLSGAQDGAFPQARRAVDFALALLGRGDSAGAQGLREKLEQHLKKFSTWKYSSLSSTERKELLEGFGKITAALEKKRVALIALSSEEEYVWALHSLVVARQLNNMFEASPTEPWIKPGIPPDADRMTAVRESGMADNVRWALDREKPTGRLIVFAHNNHVMNSSLTGGIWSAYRQPPPVMGKFLRPMLGADLVIIGGSSGAAPGGTSLKDDPNNINSAFAHLDIPRFILDLRSAGQDKTAFAWLSAPRSLHSNIETFVSVTPIDAFDALYFVDKLTGTRARQP
jgi:erythromycin esterase